MAKHIRKSDELTPFVARVYRAASAAGGRFTTERIAEFIGEPAAVVEAALNNLAERGIVRSAK
jgi:predicted transcriptional regulator